MIETDSAFISKIDEDTLKVIFKPNAFLTIKEYDTLYDHYRSVLGKDDGMKLMTIVQPGFRLEKQYSSFFTKNYRTDFKKAEAYILLHPPSRVFFKVGLKLIKGKHLARMFNNEEEALSWLKTIK